MPESGPPPRAGARGRRLGQEPDAAAVTSRGPRQAHLEGFDLHVSVWVSSHDRARLERLCRYVLRPPFAQARLRLRGDGRVALEMKTAWHDGARELVFEPLEFLERLAAMTPRPETNLLICHGVLAPRARWRERVVAYGRVLPEPAVAPRRWPQVRCRSEAHPARLDLGRSHAPGVAIDVLACPQCGGRLRLIATLHDPAVIRKILAHVGVGPSGPSAGPAPPSPAPPRPDRIGSGARRTPSCLRSEAPSALIRPPRRPVDGGDVSGIRRFVHHVLKIGTDSANLTPKDFREMERDGFSKDEILEMIGFAAYWNLNIVFSQAALAGLVEG